MTLEVRAVDTYNFSSKVVIYSFDVNCYGKVYNSYELK